MALHLSQFSFAARKCNKDAATIGVVSPPAVGAPSTASVVNDANASADGVASNNKDKLLANNAEDNLDLVDDPSPVALRRKRSRIVIDDTDSEPNKGTGNAADAVASADSGGIIMVAQERDSNAVPADPRLRPAPSARAGVRAGARDGSGGGSATATGSYLLSKFKYRRTQRQYTSNVGAAEVGVGRPSVSVSQGGEGTTAVTEQTANVNPATKHFCAWCGRSFSRTDVSSYSSFIFLSHSFLNAHEPPARSNVNPATKHFCAWCGRSFSRTDVSSYSSFIFLSHSFLNARRPNPFNIPVVQVALLNLVYTNHKVVYVLKHNQHKGLRRHMKKYCGK